MPRLSDLLSEKLKKQLAASPGKRRNAPAPAQRPASLPPTAPLPDFVAIDVETTGLDFSSDRVTEIGAVKFTGGKHAGEFSSLVNPGVPIPPVITELTGITDADVAAAPPFAAIAPELLAFIGDFPLCGHQITFDITFLNKELERAGQRMIGKLSLDTVLLSKILMQSGMRFSLKSVSDKLDVTLTNAHRALADAKASGEIATLLIPKIAELPIHVRRTMAAAAPASFLKTLIFATLGNARPAVSIQTGQTETAAPRLPMPAAFRTVETSNIRSIFSGGGGLEKNMPSFTLRPVPALNGRRSRRGVQFPVHPGGRGRNRNRQDPRLPYSGKFVGACKQHADRGRHPDPEPAGPADVKRTAARCENRRRRRPAVQRAQGPGKLPVPLPMGTPSSR